MSYRANYQEYDYEHYPFLNAEYLRRQREGGDRCNGAAHYRPDDGRPRNVLHWLEEQSQREYHRNEKREPIHSFLGPRGKGDDEHRRSQEKRKERPDLIPVR